MNEDSVAKPTFIIDNVQVMASWDWDNNNKLGLDPSVITYGSGKKAFWKCDKKHSYCTYVYRKVSGQGCPICGNRQVSIGINDLATTNPNLAKEWHPTRNGELTPRQVTSGSQKKVWWYCQEGHEWQAQIRSRNERGCQFVQIARF